MYFYTKNNQYIEITLKKEFNCILLNNRGMFNPIVLKKSDVDKLITELTELKKELK